MSVALDDDAAAFRRELDGIVEEIGKHLEDAMLICLHHWKEMRFIAAQLDRFRLRLSGKCFAGLLHNLSWINRLYLQVDPLSSAKACNREQVFDQTVHTLGRAADHLKHHAADFVEPLAGR